MTISNEVRMEQLRREVDLRELAEHCLVKASKFSEIYSRLPDGDTTFRLLLDKESQIDVMLIQSYGRAVLQIIIDALRDEAAGYLKTADSIARLGAEEVLKP